MRNPLVTVDRVKAFSDRLRKALDESDLQGNQSALARALEMRTATVNAWFDAASPSMPGGETLLRLPEQLGIDGHWLLTGEGEMIRTPPDDAVVQLDIIGKVKDGVIPPATLRVLQRAPGERPAEYAADLERAIEAWAAQTAVPK